jgi:predicted dehydrogenase
MNVPRKKTFALVGTGGRASMFLEAMADRFPDTNELCALCDLSETRMAYYNRRLEQVWNAQPVPTYPAADFDRMLAVHRPETVIVVSMDATHHDYILRALAHGCHVITEKPMTVDAPKCRAILEAAARSDRRVRVCFNYRWQAGPTQIKRLLASGAIGTMKSVALEYALDTSHGADYFRRWHSDKRNSGGLLVHKATHHFDLVNWWIDAIPEEVFAWGDLVFYGRENAVARGDEAFTRYERNADGGSADPFALLLEGEELEGLYRDAEAETGYVRNRNVFRDGITIEDTMAVLVKYRTGVVLTYSLNAFSPIEGMRVVFHGDRGRLEYAQFGSSHINRGQKDAELAAEQNRGGAFEQLRLMPHFQPGRDVEIPWQPGAHGGGDPLIVEQMFSPAPPEEHLGRNAGSEQGAASILVGIAANEAIATGQPVKLKDLVTLRPQATRLSELTR